MNAREIKGLRMKFISVAMVSIILAMVFIGFFINLFNVLNSRREIFKTLDRVIKEEGMIKEEANAEDLSLGNVFSPYYDQHTYYVFFYDQEGEIIERRISHNGKESSEAYEYADLFIHRKKDRGHQGWYYYKKETLDEGITILAVLDGRFIIINSRRLELGSALIVFAGLALALALVIRFSGKMIQPEIENSQRQDQFITNASHELKTPLAVIRSNTEMIEMIDGESEWTQATIRQVDRLTGLIQNLVMLSKSREQEGKSNMVETDLSEIVRDSVGAFEVVAVQDGKQVVKNIMPDIVRMADGSDIRQLVTILMDNAVKYCDDGGTIRIDFEGIKNKKGARLTVSNTWKEGETVDCRRFFDRFYRQEADHNIDRGGYGIGLSIAETICQKYRGSIHAEWKKGMIRFICVLM